MKLVNNITESIVQQFRHKVMNLPCLENVSNSPIDTSKLWHLCIIVPKTILETMPDALCVFDYLWGERYPNASSIIKGEIEKYNNRKDIKTIQSVC